MTIYIPSDVTNLILEYYSQLRNMKWRPFIDDKTGKLIWKINKYSAKYDNINKVSNYRKNNPSCDIPLLIKHSNNNNVTIYENIIGNIIYLKSIYIVSVLQTTIERNDTAFLQNVISSTKYKNYIEYIFKKQVSYVYVDYCIGDSKYFIFYSLKDNIGNNCYSKIHNYNIYQDTIIYARVNELYKRISEYDGYILHITEY